jgi:hypothetical protein
MAERLNAPVLKTGRPSGLGGSNPPRTVCYADVDDYRPIRSEGAAALFLPISVYLPEHLVPRKEDLRGARPPDVRLRFAWEGLGDAVGGPWSAFGSFGEGAGPIDGLYAPSRVRQSFVSAGRLGHARRRVPGGEFAAVRIGEGGAFTPEQLAGLVEPIVRGTRAFFAGADGGLSDPWYMVSFAPAGEPVENGFALGGTAVTNAFAFYFDPSVDLVAYPPLFEVVAHVLCHEYFHNWNGVLFFVGEPNYEHESRWIVEGFTDFFTRRILLRSGVYGLDSFAEAVNTRDRRVHRPTPAAASATARPPTRGTRILGCRTCSTSAASCSRC